MKLWRKLRREALVESWMHRATLPVTVRSWASRAACTGVELDLFFEKKHREAAMAMCEGCRVRMDCLRDTIRVEAAGSVVRDCQGVRAGLTAAERLQVHKLIAAHLEARAA